MIIYIFNESYDSFPILKTLVTNNVPLLRFCFSVMDGLLIKMKTFLIKNHKLLFLRRLTLQRLKYQRLI